MTSKASGFTLWLSFPWGCLRVYVMLLVFIIPAAVVTHTSASTEQKATSSLCSKLMAPLLCGGCREHRESLGGPRKPWDNIGWTAKVRLLQITIIRVCFLLTKETTGFVKNWIRYLHAAGLCIFRGVLLLGHAASCLTSVTNCIYNWFIWWLLQDLAYPHFSHSPWLLFQELSDQIDQISAAELSGLTHFLRPGNVSVMAHLH